MNNSVRTVIILTLVLGILGGLVVGFYSMFDEDRAPRRYGGTFLLETEEEYKDFKRALADPGVIRFNPPDVIASDPPIVVTLRGLLVERDYAFPFGEDAGPFYQYAALTFSLSCIAGGLAIWGLMSLTREN